MRLFEIENIYSELLNKYKSAVDFAIEQYNNNIVIYRGSYNYSKSVIYKDPTTLTTNRISANTHNYYTLWMDNDLAWSQFPKRNKSLICTTKFSIAKNYGEPVIVVPLTDCKIGICPKHDLWVSFKAIYSLSALTDWLYKYFSKNWSSTNDYWTGTNDEVTTYKDMMQKLREITPDKPKYFDPLFNDLLEKYGDAAEVMNNILDPVDNGFKLTTWKQFDLKNSGGAKNEVWLSAPCLLISVPVFENLVVGSENASL